MCLYLRPFFPGGDSEIEVEVEVEGGGGCREFKGVHPCFGQLLLQ